MRAAITTVRTTALSGLQPRVKRLILACWDVGWWAAAIAIADIARAELVPRIPAPEDLLGMAALAAFVQVVVGLASGLYRGGWRVGSFEEAVALGRSAVIVTAVLTAFDFLAARPVPISVPPLAGPLALTVTLLLRYVIRAELSRRRRPAPAAAIRLVVFGAGEGGSDAIRTMLRDPASPYLPVAVLDDDRHKRHLSLMGVPVVGTRADLAAAARRFDARVVLIAIPSASAELIREVTDGARAIGLDVKVLPALREILDGSASPGEIRSPTMGDLLGRREIKTDLGVAADYISGKRVLVTGAGGSIGSELCRQINRLWPAELIMLDRDESALHALQMSLEGRALLDTPDLVLLDIRDRRAVDELFALRRPEVVFHAAALKHLPALEMHPGEAIKTNVWGTMNVLDAAAAHGVQRLVNVSTDKAANPTSVLGYSKRMGERLTAAVAQRADGTFVSVRFGNVLGSRGSVLGAFRDQIAAGGPVTVTDEDVTRYFMTIEEAIQLVIQAGAIGERGEALVLDMGSPIRIVDVARRLIEEAGRPVEIEFTGLRPGEKLHEELFGAGEPDRRPRHPLISHVDVPVLHPGRLRSLDAYFEPAEVRSALARMASSPGLRAEDDGSVIDLREWTSDPAWLDSMLAVQGRVIRATLFEDRGACRHHRRSTDRCSGTGDCQESSSWAAQAAEAAIELS